MGRTALPLWGFLRYTEELDAIADDEGAADEGLPKIWSFQKKAFYVAELGVPFYEGTLLRHVLLERTGLQRP